MEFPFGHHHHHHHHRDEEREERREFNPPPQFPPPPSDYPPPGTQYPPGPRMPSYSVVEHHSHHGLGEFAPPLSRPGYEPHAVTYPRPGYEPHTDSYPRPGYEPPASSYPRPGYEPHANSYPRPGFEPSGHSIPRLPNGQLCRVSCKADPDFSLAIRHGSVVLVHANPNDESQQWFKDETFSTKVKDERSFPSFALVNKATRQALKHGLGETQPVLLSGYEPDTLDESILWTMSEDMGAGYRTLRQVNNIRLNLDAFHGDKKSGGIKDGTSVVLWGWKKGENQLWKIVPY